MKTKHFIMTLATAVAAVWFTMSNTQAAERSGGGRFRSGSVLQHVAEKLNLSDEQRAQIRAGLSGEKNTLKSLFTRLHKT